MCTKHRGGYIESEIVAIERTAGEAEGKMVLGTSRRPKEEAGSFSKNNLEQMFDVIVAMRTSARRGRNLTPIPSGLH